MTRKLTDPSTTDATSASTSAARRLPVDRETYDKILAYAAEHGEVVFTQQASASARELLQRGGTTLLEVAQGKAPLLMLPKGVTDVTQGVRMVLAQNVAPTIGEPATFRPQREGLTRGARALIQGKQRQPLKAAALDVDMALVQRTADEVDVLHELSSTLRGAADAIDRSAAVKEDTLYRTVKEGIDVLGPVARRNESVRSDFADMFAYRETRYDKATSSRRANAARDEATREAVREEITEDVRAEVTDEVVRTMAQAPAPGPLPVTIPAGPQARKAAAVTAPAPRATTRRAAGRSRPRKAPRK